ncbi:Type III restriction enzyme, res subunit family protein [Tritrichomonas foetus]|uniref:Type III restriction enzyme, res subunit family protein n=1 Tax=Tritrichomonas foetus TaxID=1144522 RepID=A0A1J4JW79_9EUKA|nr:Type III restriction enzyme, res subunit family protein [Tritrichomonas foetus]|eukprot:OHT03259.1 Type III restriction enzyme, res subunit family protein [Tritrichomonas foetus]
MNDNIFGKSFFCEFLATRLKSHMSGEMSSAAMTTRNCRRNNRIGAYDDFDSSGPSAEDNDSDFAADNRDDDDDVFIEENYRKSISRNRKKKSKQNTSSTASKNSTDRPTTGLYNPKKKYSRSTDSDSDDISFPIRSISCNSIALRREKRVKNVAKYSDDIPYYEDSTEDGGSSSLLPDGIDAPPLVPIEKIIGIKNSVDPPVFFVRLVRSSNAEAEFMTREDLEQHPGGHSHLSNWDSQVQEFGLKQLQSIPFLSVPAAPHEKNQEPRIIDHIVAFDREKQLYLVKWQDESYDDATWEATVVDDHALRVFKRRESYQAPKIQQMPCSFKEYGVGENCIPLPKYKNDNTLRQYQVEALNWLLFAYQTHKNTILADEMGLGKTVMCISLLNDIVKNYGMPGPFLVVAPLGTLPNWKREFENWTDINCVMFHGSKQERQIIKKYEVFYDPPHENTTKCQVILTNIETVNKELELIQSIKWHFVIIDEAHRLKNMHSKIYRYMYSLQMDHILLMTGTPIQNNIDEIFALLHFIAPNQFPSLEEFKSKHHNIESAEDVKSLKAALKPYMLRRKKRDVEASIAGKEETIVEVELTRIQKFYYRLLIDRKSEELTKKYQKISELQNLAMQLRKVCNHPFLLPEVEKEIVKDGQNPLNVMIESSGKLVFVDKLLAKLAPTGEKVLIFSQMVKVLDILEDFLTYRHYKFERLDGQVHGALRQASIDRFNDKESNVFVFLLCTKAGGVGLNLTAASTVIIYDSDWNPQNDIQAQARCHRIGQTHDVQVYRLVTRGTYENEMFERASMKLGLDQAILDSKTDNPNNMNAKEIEQLIKKGAYYIFNEDETETDKFIAEDIDLILQHRTKKFSQPALDTDSSFSKASFIIDKDGDQLDLNDEHFWERVLPETKKHNRQVSNDLLRPRRTRSSMDFSEETDDDGEDEYGSTWSLSKLDKLFNQMISVGFGRWELIRSRIKANISMDMVIDGCTVLLSIITQELEHPQELLHFLFESGNINLTARQRRISTLDAFTNRKLREKIARHADQNARRLMQLKAIQNWIEGGCKPLRFDPHASPKNWTPQHDINLLNSVWKHGFGEWPVILGDTEIWGENPPVKMVSTYSRRLATLNDSLIDGQAFEILNTPAGEMKHIDSNNLKAIVHAISDIGNIPERVGELVDIDRCSTLVPIVITCARIVSSLDPKFSQATIRTYIAQYCQHTENIAPLLSYQTAKRLCDNTNWLQRLRDSLEASPISAETLENVTPPSTSHPAWWKSSVHDLFLLNHLNDYGFHEISSLVLDNDNFYSHLNETEIEYINTIAERKRKHGFIRQAKGVLGFLFQEDALISWIEELMQQIGGWSTPPYIDIPEKFRNGVILPAAYGSESIESLGDGETLILDGILYKIGFRARVLHKNIGYRCSILDKNLFEIWKSDRAKWTGENPYDVWTQVDKQFATNALVAFGLDCPFVQYEYIREIDEELPDGYIPPRINFYQTESPVSRKKKIGKQGNQQQKKRQYTKRKKTDDSETDSDPDNEDDDDFEYSDQ